MSINPPSPQPNSSSSASNWTEPPWSGWIETTGDALLILEAARRGLIPRVTRRLVDSERKMITSGSVFVFDEDESGIKRWTDGFFWSPSRILGNFLLYRETDKRGAGHRGARSDLVAPVAETLLVNELQQYTVDGTKIDGQTLSRPKGEVGGMGIDRHRERSLVGSLTNSYKFKPDGMMKKTFSLTISGVSQHLISYYKVEDVEQGRLRTPSSLPELASLDISPEYLDKTHFRNPPKVEYGIDGRPRYRGESDESDPSPRATTAPLSSGVPLLLDSRASIDNGSMSSAAGKRTKRYDPYGSASPTGVKRARKGKAAQHAAGVGDEDAHSHVAASQGAPAAHVQAQYAPPDPNAPPPHPPYPPYSVLPPSYYQVPPGYPMPPPPPHPMYAAQPPPPPGSPYPAPGAAGGAQQHQAEGATPPATSTSPPPAGAGFPYPPADQGQQPPGQQQQQQHYTFYPPGHYPPPYGSMQWSAHYAAYPPQQQQQQQQQQGMAPPPHAAGAGGDGRGAGDDVGAHARVGVDVAAD